VLRRRRPQRSSVTGWTRRSYFSRRKLLIEYVSNTYTIKKSLMQNPAVVGSGLPFPTGRLGRLGALPADGRGLLLDAADICLSSGQFPPPVVRLFMIVGSWRRYSPLLTHDHERRTYGGYQQNPVTGSPLRAWQATWLHSSPFVDYAGIATAPSSQRRAPGHWCRLEFCISHNLSVDHTGLEPVTFRVSGERSPRLS
jgi:hypothetical protein